MDEQPPTCPGCGAIGQEVDRMPSTRVWDMAHAPDCRGTRRERDVTVVERLRARLGTALRRRQ